ncbi:DNA end-binding protein Ku [Humitalea rosea]|uniref:Non-homologous end joining protein Ku n=1 Tax=Humitalea rosea TaxID=990373 RepID=A0A2W7JX70_9PROT|nr:Ku protein [Humitalea rosea]PZW40070.1 DNA end-binding protein Ku [Humitalea rosea]
MAQRPSWEGHLRLSLVACPVSLYPATSSADAIRFHLINPETGNRIRTQAIDPEAGEVERKDLVRGYEYEKDQYVLLTDAEIRSVRIESTETIDIERFVDAAEIDRIWWNDPYYLVPDGKAGIDAFTIIRTSMEQSRKIALGRVVLGTRERIVAIEPRGKGMLVTTLRSRDELRDETELFAAIPSGKADSRMIEIAEKIIAQQAGPFDPDAFNDRYEDALRALIQSKQEDGDGGVTAPPPRDDNVIDLMEALRRSLDAGQAPATRRPAAKAKTPPAKTPAKPKRKRAAG